MDPCDDHRRLRVLLRKFGDTIWGEKGVMVCTKYRFPIVPSYPHHIMDFFSASHAPDSPSNPALIRSNPAVLLPGLVP